MRRQALRALAVTGVGLSVVPTVLIALAHADPAPAVFSQYSTTSVVRATATGGNIGATGGLTPLDSGTASVDAALDNSPTSMVLARPVEPGTTYATVASQVPVEIPVPEAAAAYPGSTPAKSVTVGPATSATAKVTQTSAEGTATSAGTSSNGVVEGAVTAASTLVATGGGHTVTADADGYVSGISFGGVLDLKGIRGIAHLDATAGGKRTATASTVIGSATVAGQPVVIDDTGVHAVGTTAPLGPTLQQLTSAANAALKAAGISTSVAAPIHTITTSSLGSHAVADSGGVQVTIMTAEVGTATVPANTVAFSLGRVVLTESDSPSSAIIPPVQPTQEPSDPSVIQPQPGTSTVPGLPGRTITIPGIGGTSPAPQVISGQPPAVAQALSYQIGGHHVTAQEAIAGLGGWMALTLGAATFAMIGLRKPEEEEHLCPCP